MQQGVLRLICPAQPAIIHNYDLSRFMEAATCLCASITNRADTFYCDCHHHYHYFHLFLLIHPDHCSDQPVEDEEETASVLQAADCPVSRKDKKQMVENLYFFTWKILYLHEGETYRT